MMNDNSLDTDEAQLFAAVHGVTPAGAPPDELGSYLQTIRGELCRPPDAQARWNHLAAMRRAIPAPQKRRKIRGIVAIVAATAGLVTATTGLAAADRLPRAAQDQVAKLAEIVGVDLPGNDHAPAASIPKPTAGLDNSTQGTAPSADDRRPGPGAKTPNAGRIENRSDAGSGSKSDETPATTPPGHSGSTPGGSGSTPGGTVIPPGQGGADPPGQSGSAPGHGGSGPGNSENAPGHVDGSPGKSGSAPGHTGSAGTTPGTPSAAAGSNGVAAAHANAHANPEPVSKAPPRAIASVTVVPSTDVTP